MGLLTQLQDWYESQCNHDWEHHFGISIDTLDNPGWTVSIDLSHTDLEQRAFEAFESHRSDEDWIKCWVEDNKFHGVGGSKQLAEILSTFLSWARKTIE